MKLYTRTGDSGETSLLDGSRVPKDDPRVAACGSLDELGAALGWCRAADCGEVFSSQLDQLQRELFSVGAELAMPRGAEGAHAGAGFLLPAEAGERLEAWIDRATDATGPLGSFILCGGTELSCRFHLARTCCRRAERSVVTLARSFPVRREVLVYLNRLGDLLFAWARQANREAGQEDDTWTARA